MLYVKHFLDVAAAPRFTCLAVAMSRASDIIQNNVNNNNNAKYMAKNETNNSTTDDYK